MLRVGRQCGRTLWPADVRPNVTHDPATRRAERDEPDDRCDFCSPHEHLLRMQHAARNGTPFEEDTLNPVIRSVQGGAVGSRRRSSARTPSRYADPQTVWGRGRQRPTTLHTTARMAIAAKVRETGPVVRRADDGESILSSAPSRGYGRTLCSSRVAARADVQSKAAM